MGVSAILRSGMWKLALAHRPAVWWRLAAHDEAAMDLVQPSLTRDAVYLSTLGVDPSLAGKGHGGRLLTKATEALAATFKRCVLRTEQPRNVAFYQKNGFELVNQSTMHVSGLKVWVFSKNLVRQGD
jgi:ribosomal protein S18 acetylase RimI-like enzyme